MKVNQALRLCLEALGFAALLAVPLFWMFPGALQGLGLTEAIMSARQTAGEASTGSSPGPVIAPADMVAVLLTVVTMMLGVLAFLVSLAAIVGYSAIRDNAVSAAGDAARAEASQILPKLAQAEVTKAVGEIAPRLINDAVTRATETALRRLSKVDEEEEVQGQGLPIGEGADAYAEPPPSVGQRNSP